MRQFTSIIVSLALSIAAVGCATSGSDDDGYSEASDEAAAPGQFDIYQSTDGQYRFRLLAGNKNILLSSEAYTSRTNAIAGALSVMANGVDPALYELAASANGKYFLRLHAAANSQVIGSSQVYANKSSATRAVTSCVRAVTSYLDQVYARTAGARVVLGQGAAAGTFSFTVHGADGQVIVTSHAYDSEASALNGAFAIQEGAQIATGFKLVDADGAFSFHATASNGAVIATSPTFPTREAASAAMAAARALLPAIDVL